MAAYRSLAPIENPLKLYKTHLRVSNIDRLVVLQFPR